MRTKIYAVVAVALLLAGCAEYATPILEADYSHAGGYAGVSPTPLFDARDRAGNVIQGGGAGASGDQ